MKTLVNISPRKLGLFVCVFVSCRLLADPTNTCADLNQLAWFYGRNYFVLRSGPVQMILQSDKAALGPGLSYLLFDIRDARQSRSKTGALNWVKDAGVVHSAAQVVLGGYPFEPLGHRTQATWEVGEDGAPGVRVTWWAGGIRVSEWIRPLGDSGMFAREIQLDGAHLVTNEEVLVRLHLPGLGVAADPSAVVSAVSGANLALGLVGDVPSRTSLDTRQLEVGPVTVRPSSAVRLLSLLGAQLQKGDPDRYLSWIHQQRFAELVANSAQRWKPDSRIITSDQTVQTIYDKARFQLAGMVADDGTMNAGIFEYGAQWVRDTSNTALGLLHAGQFEATRAALVRMLTKMVSSEGITMIANAFEKPDLEQFDQMGELLHLLKAYRDWTGDDLLIRQHRELLLALVERPLRSEFRDATGMVHNRREFWERSFSDAYELAYQTYVILGLNDAADLAESLDAVDRAPRWRAEADRILNSVLHHPERALVNDGHLIKRRNVTGEIADDPGQFRGFKADVPLNTERAHRLMPDASIALPLALGVVDSASPLGLQTLEQLEQLWNTRWSDGGYDRYHTSSQPDQPGPWPFATTFILRAQHEAGLWNRSRRSLEWLNTSAGGETGAWFEEISSVRSQMGACGLVPWTSGEVALFVVRHYLGVHFQGIKFFVRPKLYPGSPPVSADLRFRQGRLHLEIAGDGRVKQVTYNDRALPLSGLGEVALP
jgi:hypothetical protein